MTYNPYVTDLMAIFTPLDQIRTCDLFEYARVDEFEPWVGHIKEIDGIIQLFLYHRQLSKRMLDTQRVIGDESVRPVMRAGCAYEIYQYVSRCLQFPIRYRVRVDSPTHPIQYLRSDLVEGLKAHQTKELNLHTHRIHYQYGTLDLTVTASMDIKLSIVRQKMGKSSYSFTIPPQHYQRIVQIFQSYQDHDYESYEGRNLLVQKLMHYCTKHNLLGDRLRDGF